MFCRAKASKTTVTWGTVSDTGAEPHCCSECGKNISRQNDFVRHMVKRHSIELHPQSMKNIGQQPKTSANPVINKHASREELVVKLNCGFCAQVDFSVDSLLDHLFQTHALSKHIYNEIDVKNYLIQQHGSDFSKMKHFFEGANNTKDMITVLHKEFGKYISLCSSGITSKIFPGSKSSRFCQKYKRNCILCGGDYYKSKYYIIHLVRFHKISTIDTKRRSKDTDRAQAAGGKRNANPRKTAAVNRGKTASAAVTGDQSGDCKSEYHKLSVDDIRAKWPSLDKLNETASPEGHVVDTGRRPRSVSSNRQVRRRGLHEVSLDRCYGSIGGDPIYLNKDDGMLFQPWAAAHRANTPPQQPHPGVSPRVTKNSTEYTDHLLCSVITILLHSHVPKIMRPIYKINPGTRKMECIRLSAQIKSKAKDALPHKDPQHSRRASSNWKLTTKKIRRKIKSS